MFEVVDQGPGTEFMATKPWQGTIDHSVPRNYKPSPLDLKEPEAALELEYIYGYRCKDV